MVQKLQDEMEKLKKIILLKEELYTENEKARVLPRTEVVTAIRSIYKRRVL